MSTKTRPLKEEIEILFLLPRSTYSSVLAFLAYKAPVNWIKRFQSVTTPL